jgi:hypothetical protein
MAVVEGKPELELMGLPVRRYYPADANNKLVHHEA